MSKLHLSVTGLTGRAKSVYHRKRYPQKPIPNMHALVIGIDNYAYDKVPGLSGAVADADRIDLFLRNELSVPDNQIVVLLNEAATRQAIIHHFRAFRQNPNINPLDPILIYFSGHGTEVDTPNACTQRGHKPKTQCLVPQDVGLRDEAGDPICPIPDYTISLLLYDLAEAKGNNITVILDCCHSASTTRGVLNSSRRLSQSVSAIPSRIKTTFFGATQAQARYTDPSELPKLQGHLDNDIIIRSAWDLPQSPIARETLGARKSFQRGMRSHVLLAACAHSQQAFERRAGRGGYFTSYLLSYLRHHEIHKLTYKTCMDDFPTLNTPRHQTPVCEGEHVNRFFFNASAPEAHSSLIPIIFDGVKYVLKAGTAQGIMPNSRFSIHQGNALGPHNPDIGQCRIHVVIGKPSVSVCGLTGQIKDALNGFRMAMNDSHLLGVDSPVPPTPITAHPRHRGTLDSVASPASTTRIVAFARLLEPMPSHTLDVYFTAALKEAFLGDIAQLLDMKRTKREDQVQFEASSPEEANVILGLDDSDGHVNFTLANPVATPEHMSCVLPHTIAPNPDSVKSVLSSMLQWRWHVLREPSDGIRPFEKDLRIKFYKLGRTDDSRDDDNLVPVTRSLNENGIVTISSSSEEQYGLKIINKSYRSLYAYPFYFSTANQSIRPLFFRVYGRNRVDAPLEVNGEMSMGCGDDDYLPLSFQLSEATELSENLLDVGIIRFFVTTSSADFESVAQPSPFTAPAWVEPGEDEFSDGLSFEPKRHAMAALANESIRIAASPLSAQRSDVRMFSSEMAGNFELWDVVDMKIIIRRDVE